MQSQTQWRGVLPLACVDWHRNRESRLGGGEVKELAEAWGKGADQSPGGKADSEGDGAKQQVSSLRCLGCTDSLPHFFFIEF